MSYENAQHETFTYLDSTFGATAVTHSIKGPKGKVGFVRDIAVEVTTNLVGTTTVPEVQVGISSGDYTYGRFRLGTTASNGYTTGFYRASQLSDIVGNPPRTATGFSGHAVLDGGPWTGTSGSVGGGTWTTVNPAGRIAADAAVTITNLAGVGGTPAGGGLVRVTIQWVGPSAD